METTKTRVNYYLLALCLLLLVGMGLLSQQQNNTEGKLREKVKLEQALRAEMEVSKDDLGNVTSEKLALQASVKDLNKIKDELTLEKQQLLGFVEKQDKQNKLLAAAIVQMGVEVKELRAGVPVAITDSSAQFAVVTDTISYRAEIANVRIIPNIPPTLLIRDLKIPNQSQVSFQWGEKKEGYPVSFKITNTNPLFKTYNIESYAIPELKKEVVRPNLGQRLGLTIKNGKTPFVIGLSAGAVGVLFLTGVIR